ncbi:MAG TPA: Rrf2 family transcriptional regulator [Smithellaceae bacterium]|nr:Rrf2 family transcriptional regulator [Smithellaceae bacterium]HRS89378.1 Rrf2 family transcriptional regulator [Smithellaceae bacterium]HRV26583.1 Rrf2 family transcriptional regulator [Smithellaceae bacterium]
MKLSTRARYGVRMMIDLALHHGGEPVLLKDIACRQAVSEKYLSQIVIPLRSAGLVRSVRGAHGGYKLADKPDNITLRDVVEALDGEIFLVDCVSDMKNCPRVSICATREIWSLLGRKITDTLQATTLSDLVIMQRRKANNNLMNDI